MSTESKRQPAPLWPAATVVLLRERAGGMEVFMVKRHDAMEFGGALVFPGGRVDAGDSHPALLERCSGGSGLSTERKAVALAGIREAFEEAGLLLARRSGADTHLSAADVEALAADRTALAHNRLTLADFAQRHDLAFNLDDAVLFGHWQTPTRADKRYDTYFFAAAAPTGQLAAHDHESVESLWISPQDGLEAVNTGRFQVLPPTRMNLLKLSRYPTIDAALATFRSETVFTVLPRPELDAPGGPVVHIPAEAGYGVTAIPVGPHRAQVYTK
jgi:8-oxo-dGTP pyrophosphatase MutT (NUDIX family)